MCQIETETRSDQGKELKIQRHKKEQETNKTDKNKKKTGRELEKQKTQVERDRTWLREAAHFEIINIVSYFSFGYLFLSFETSITNALQIFLRISELLMEAGTQNYLTGYMPGSTTKANRLGGFVRLSLTPKAEGNIPNCKPGKGKQDKR